MDIAISNSDSTMYRVAKISNDGGAIKYMVYNNGSKSSVFFGKFVLVFNDGLYVQEQETYSIRKCDIRTAALEVSSESAYAPTLAILELLEKQTKIIK